MIIATIEHEGEIYDVVFRSNGNVSAIYKFNYENDVETCELLKTKSTKKVFGVMPREIFIKAKIDLKERL
jgi:hypothetical protein